MVGSYSLFRLQIISVLEYSKDQQLPLSHKTEQSLSFEVVGFVDMLPDPGTSPGLRVYPCGQAPEITIGIAVLHQTVFEQ